MASSTEQKADDEPLSSFVMHRQDSGYQSLDPVEPKISRRQSSPTSASSHNNPRTRPSARRSAKSGPVSYMPRASGRSLDNARASVHSHQSYRPSDGATFFHFPHFPFPEQEGSSEDPALLGGGAVAGPDPAHELPTYPPPPQTTHYWTSDRTRRLEYAAIDAASRGVRGWAMRHIVPDCFIPKDRRRIGFDDDRGSVVRYRLELDTEESGEKDEFEGSRKGRRSWWFTSRGH